jgi:hypothetical protein
LGINQKNHMNKKELRNRGAFNPGFIVTLAIMVIVGIGLWVVPGNEIYEAPLLNKAVGVFLLLVAAWWIRQWSRDAYTFTSSWIVDFFIYLAIFLGIAALGFTVLIVWHSGPLGTTTNPI